MVIPLGLSAPFSPAFFPFQPVNDANLFGTGHKFVPGTAMYWQFGVKKSSES
jgi:hypothetical protein